MTQNEIARRLQKLLDDYQRDAIVPAHMSDHAVTVKEASAGIALATSVGYLITDIDADVERERYQTSEREHYAPSATDERVTAWHPVALSPLNSEDGEAS